MDLILCHQTADFDSLGAAVGLSRLITRSRIVLTGGAHPGVRNFLALHRDEFALIESRSVNPKNIRSLTIVDTQKRSRLGKCAQWLDLPQLTAIEIYDHHFNDDSDILATQLHLAPVGAATTIVVEQLQANNIQLTSFEATVMGLGIHVDTGSLTFEQTTSRDAYALAWLMTQGANVRIIYQYVDPSLSPQLQKLLTEALEKMQKSTVLGYTLATVLLKTDNFVPGLSNLTETLIDLTEADLLLLGHEYKSEQDGRLTIIGRTRIEQSNLNQVFAKFDGGGHPQAASVTLKGVDSAVILQQFLEELKAQIPHPPTARDLMSSPVRTIRPETTIEQAQRILLRYGHSGLCVVDENGQLQGIISRRDLDLALHHGFSHAPVKGYMARNVKTITPNTSLPEIESVMVTYDVGRLPVLEEGKLLGIVTRTDVLRQIHQDRIPSKNNSQPKLPLVSCLLPSIRLRLNPEIWSLLTQFATEAEKRGWHLYLVGGAVRDLMLATEDKKLLLQDIDLVVDGFHRSADTGAGVELASQIQKIYPNVRVSVHGEFQTAALLWHKDAKLDSLWVDIATARTEFYPYPAANPEVEASSIRQDLYRRDFTINALAVRLTNPRAGELLDYFGGVLDLKSRQIRVLHANSFIEDPTRIYRAVRFAVRLGFEIEPQTEEYIRYAIESGVYERLRATSQVAPALSTRLKAELKYILQADYWKEALKLLNSLGALRCLGQSLVLNKDVWWQIRFVERALKCLNPDKLPEQWLIRLEVLIASTEPSERGKIATYLELPKDSISRLKQLHEVQEVIWQSLPNCHRNSEIFHCLHEQKLLSVILVASLSPKPIRRKIWYYLSNLSKVQAPLNGNDLKALGYKPGPQYKQVLADLLSATLDGEISDRADAEVFVRSFLDHR